MRLIDADTLIDEIKSQVNECCTDNSLSSLSCQFTAFAAEMVIKLINRWPTVYDVEKVVEEERNFLVNYGVPETAPVHRKIISIIKGGLK